MQQQLLVVDDSKPIHALVTGLLAEEPVDVHAALDAGYGLTLAASLRPDLILMDVEMPGIDGFEACRRLKADPATAGVPVVFLTGVGGTEDKVRGLELGAVDYITKPFKASEFLARVRASLRTSHLIRLLEEKALIDSLTGLGNRALFDQRLGAEVSLRIRTNHPLSVILLDIDGFKSINDSFGHPFGDNVLKKVARTIAELCRAEDVACRFGGEEFVVLTPNTPAVDAALLAERMRAAVAGMLLARQGSPIKVTCSLGVAEALDTYDRTMVDRADEALYQSKQHGRNRVSVASSHPAQRSAVA